MAIIILPFLLFGFSDAWCQPVLHPGNKKLRIDGIYSSYDTTWNSTKTRRKYEGLVTDHFLLFLADSNKVYYDCYTSPYYSAFQSDFYRRVDSNNTGTYTIKGDTIYAILPSVFALRGMRLKKFKTCYKGIIKNTDTIIDWRMIPPYPKVNRKLNDYFASDTTPMIKYFIKNDAAKAYNGR